MKNLFAFSFVIIVGIFVAGCMNTETPRKVPASVPATAQPAVSADGKELAEIEKDFENLKSERHLSEGWAVDVRPGDTRDANSIAGILVRLKYLQANLDKLGPSDRVANLSNEIRQVRMDDLKLLLRISLRDKDLDALSSFLRYAPEMDTDLENDFGIKPENLRAEALIMAKKEVAELRPRLHGESSDAVGAVIYIMREWQFTPKEIGLTAEDLKTLR